MTAFGLIHVVAAVAALVLGGLTLLAEKGTESHVRLARSYLIAMLAVNAAALLVYEDSPGGFGPFHYLALVSVATIASGWGIILSGRGGRRALAVHAHLMGWSYAGLVAASFGRTAAMLDGSVWIVILAVLALGGFLVHTLTPVALAAMWRRG